MPATAALLHLHCNACGHDYSTPVLDAVISGDVLTSGYCGSAADFCESCDSSDVESVDVTVGSPS